GGGGGWGGATALPPSSSPRPPSLCIPPPHPEPPLPPPPLPPLAGALLAAPPLTPAQVAWQQGQLAMTEGQTDRAIACYKKSLELDPKLHRNFLSLAAAYLEKADDEQACVWLGRYVKAQPDHLAVRL